MEKYKDVINQICSSIHTGLIDFSEPRSKASIPTQASSEFITNKQQGDWAEEVILELSMITPQISLPSDMENLTIW